MFASQGHARIMQVHFQLATLKKGNSSVIDYFHNMKTLSDTLATCGQPLNDFETVSFLLAGVGSEFDPLVTSVTTRVDPISRDDIYDSYSPMRCVLSNNWLPLISQIPLLISLHALLVILASVVEVSMLLVVVVFLMAVAIVVLFLADVVPHLVHMVVATISILVLHAPHVSSVRSATSQDTMQSLAVRGLISPLRMTLSPPCRILYSSPSLPTDDSWYPNTGATHHLTSDLHNLNLTSDAYPGSDQIHVGNGTSLSINHIGSALISSSRGSFILNQLVHVPSICKNLLSVCQFAHDHSVFFQFH